MVLVTEDPTARNTMVEDGGYFLVKVLGWGLWYMGNTIDTHIHTHLVHL